ncbi:hypothetical protein [Lacimicrobium alkaliphilum]|uniref:Uncharacterized protein n=1 Tax=Lacimicrobium alkaliphilum TaxID=1526571 RepID=A0A0U3AK22_9ALTE|nr:hypothetical protein [Lacimicrobium alkaliphilum]ALS98322.1 hypothetical protein AT746_08700 [Lacimicrobium alkaliphilum]
MQIQNGLSLFDYLDDPQKSQQSLQQIASNAGQNIGAELTELGQTGREQMDDVLKKIESGESAVKMQTLDNMIAFNLRPVAAELQDLADRLNLPQPVSLQQQQGKWQVEGADAEPENKSLQRMQQYLDANQPLQDKLSQLSRLSEMYELGKTREFATELKAQDVLEQKVVDFLTHSRDHLKAASDISLYREELKIQSRGQAQSLYDSARKTLGLD